jgi:flagellar hook protein FlgE
MLDMMSQAKNAIEAYNSALRASTSDIANVSVPGYKSLDVSFQSVFEKVLTRGTAAEAGMGGINPRQLGQGMSLSSVSIDFSQGEQVDGSNLDLYIQGQGLFIVSPDGGNSYLYSRAGRFELDDIGNLTSNGMQVYGLDSSDNLVPITGLKPPDYNPTLLSWANDGRLVQYKDTTYTQEDFETPFRIALTYFPNPSGLTQAQGTTLAQTIASGSPATAQTIGGAAGSIVPRKFEQSNVDYFSETIDTLALQRAVNSNLTIIRMASDMISQFINRLS